MIELPRYIQNKIKMINKNNEQNKLLIWDINKFLENEGLSVKYEDLKGEWK